MIRFILTLLVIGVLGNMQAQQFAAPSGCGYDHYVHYLDQTYPGFKQAADDLFQRNAEGISSRDLELLTIPVVVHVVWQNEEQNLADSLIEQVIDVLNEDYRRLNADAGLVRAEFEDVVGDAFIEFELAGIERVETEASFELDLLGGGLPDNVKQSTEGGSDAWNTTQYLNIWVCNIEGGSLLGYAYPPAGLDHWPEGADAPSPNLDGVVIHYPVFKRTGTYTATGLLGGGETTVPVRGRAITHEVAHYLGLRHIWGDGLLSLIGFPDCDADDGVEDTPQQGLSSQFQCDPTQNTCTDIGTDLPDMFENFMDYAADDCMNSFTLQQIAIMRSVLENERNGLIGEPVNNEEIVAAENPIRVYPNPVSRQLYVATNLPLSSTCQIQLFDTQGRLLKTAKSGIHETIAVDVSDLPTGLYGLRITQGKQHYFQRVLVE
ncbi:MAG: hypothetical protein DHS20C18_40450 [Saprospiraceae bacterium]|nr:MAG: hypothetical protein DHS20C18_40450 [Saprospiraceae bacterium]